MTTVAPVKPVIWPHEDVNALNAFYGNPRGRNGNSSPAWESANLVTWIPPYPMFYSDEAKTPLKRLRVHKKCLDAFNAAFKEVLDTLGIEYIKEHRLDISGGLFCYRVERGGSRLSVHSWACAIDMDPGHNPFPHHYVAGCKMIDPKFVAILTKHGFCWRGAGNDIDPMHFQCARH